jgi:bifunctional UDP-N-acetylglucosamine pyrophosphorylase/glucosamine-1-phosphate N-acetyltransferase
MNDKLAVIILAAGLGKRMRSKLPKVVISSREMPLIHHVLHAVASIKADKTIIVTGYQKELVEAAAREFSKKNPGSALEFAYQEKQLGTGDAVKSALHLLKGFTGSVLILYGDTPLISPASLKALKETHNKNKATLSLISFNIHGENNYGRIIRGEKDGQVEKIIEAKDCSPQELKITELNSGIYIVDSSFLEPAVNELKNENKQKEFYLTDIVERAAKEGQTVCSMVLENPTEVLGVNTLLELSTINKALIMKKINELIENGVIFDLPETCIVDNAVEMEAGVKVGPNTQILGNTKISRGTIIEGNSYINNSILGEGVTVKFSVKMEGAKLARNSSVGPFAHLRPETSLEEDCKIGNFVETKKAVLGKGSKASHLTYLGDCTVGSNSNIGAGTITCNYDGFVKNKTTIGNDVFIGSNTALVAPVVIEDGATVGAGSVITKTVEKDSLAFTRSAQVSKTAWSKNKREKAKKA